MSDRLDHILRDDARHAIGDEGFTARVMGALPAPAARRPRALHQALVPGATLAACGLAALWAPGDFNIAQGFVDLAQLKGFTPAAFAAMGMAAMLLVCAVVLAAETE